jgi:hypothetical protein
MRVCWAGESTHFRLSRPKWGQYVVNLSWVDLNEDIMLVNLGWVDLNKDNNLIIINKTHVFIRFHGDIEFDATFGLSSNLGFAYFLWHKLEICWQLV